MILAGDIGGTKTLIALFDRTDGLHVFRETSFASQAFASLEEILVRFLSERSQESIEAACFGVAGPVVNGECRTTNLPWHLTEVSLAQAAGVPRVKLLNDLQATAYGMLHLPPEQLAPLNPRATGRQQGNIAVIAAGTGLGEGILYWDGSQYHPLGSEGGHSDFAPRTDPEIDLLRYLRKEHEHVSWERLLSGPGIHNIFCFLRDTSGRKETPELSALLREADDPSVAISRMGLAGTDPLCVETLELFAVLYGAETSNLALKCLATGGVFIGGGIAPKILPVLKGDGFLRGFLDKGRLRTLLEPLPIHVSLNPRAALLGAAFYAARLVGPAAPLSPPAVQP
jgi:glucokinase